MRGGRLARAEKFARLYGTLRATNIAHGPYCAALLRRTDTALLNSSNVFRAILIKSLLITAATGPVPLQELKIPLSS